MTRFTSTDQITMDVVPPTRRDASPWGTPPMIILLMYLATYSLSGCIMQAILPVAEWMERGGVLSDVYQSTAERHDKIVNILNVGFSYSLLVTPVIQMAGRRFGGIQFVGFLWLLCHAGGLALAFTYGQGSEAAAWAGMVLAAAGFPCAQLFVAPFIGMFPKCPSLITAVLSCAQDLSQGAAAVMMLAATYTGMSTQHFALLYCLLWSAALLLPSMLMSPKWGAQDWMNYIIRRKRVKEMITHEEYCEAINPKEANADKKDGFNPHLDPPYHGLTFHKMLSKPQMWTFMLYFICHFMRIKKVLVPFIDQILLSKAMREGIPEESAQYWIKLFMYVPTLGWIPCLGFGFFAVMFGNAMSSWFINFGICVVFTLLLYGPWNDWILGAALCGYIVNSGICYGMGCSFLLEIFGILNISTAISFLYLFCGTLSLIVDFIYPKLVNSVWNGDFFMSAKVFLSLLNIGAFVGITSAIIWPPPKN